MLQLFLFICIHGFDQLNCDDVLLNEYVRCHLDFHCRIVLLY